MMIGYALSILMMLSVLHGGPNSPQKENTTMELFLSYCHTDKEYLDAFRKHITPLKQKGVITDWHYREIPVGEHIEQAIDAHLESADIIALFVSADFLASKNCQKEVEVALSLKETKRADIMPIIVSPCDWQDSKLGEFMACPTDGKAVVDWSTPAHAWVNVTKHLKDLLQHLVVKKKDLTKNHRDFMENPGDFVTSSRKEVLRLQDFYTYPSLRRQPLDDNEGQVILDQQSANFLTDPDSIAGKTILVLGDDFSGKTALCNTVCGKLMEFSYVPVYVHGENITNANIRQIEKLAFEQQYEYLRNNAVPNDKKIVILDNFASENIKEKHLRSLLENIEAQGYHSVILTASTMTPLFQTLEWYKLARDSNIAVYNITDSSYLATMKVIRNWIAATHEEEDISGRENLEKEYFEFTRSMFMDNTIPSYPPYIILILQSKAAFSMVHRGNDEMSSYGHCYNALIVHALLKSGVSSKKIGGYHTLLVELAHYMYASNKTVITHADWKKFIAQHQDNYFLDNPREVKERLIKSRILSEDLMGISMLEHAFYYFIAKSMSNDFDSETLREKIKQEIVSIFSGVHRKRNGHILLFLVTHMPKNEYLLKKLGQEMNSSFSQFAEAKLTAEDMKPLHQFLDGQPAIGVKTDIPESERQASRDEQVNKAEMRDRADSEISQHAEYDSNDADMVNVGKSFRMMKIAGSLLKNERDSMEKKSLAALSASVRGLSLRFLSFQHQMMAKHSDILESFLDNMMSKRSHKWKKMGTQKKKDVLKKMVGRWIIGVAYGMITRCALCIGSEKLTALLCQKDSGKSCPSYQLLHLATSMWYGKSIDSGEIESLYKKWSKDNFTGVHLLQLIVVEHMQTHKMSRPQRQKICDILGLDVKSQNLIEYKRVKS